MKVYLLIREGPEWSSVVDVYAQRPFADARAKVLNEGARVSKDTFESLSSYRVEERKVVQGTLHVQVEDLSTTADRDARMLRSRITVRRK